MFGSSVAAAASFIVGARGAAGISLLSQRGIRRCFSLTTAKPTYKFERYIKFRPSTNIHTDHEKLEMLAFELPPSERDICYEVVETEQAPQPVKVILLKNTDDFGPRGQIVTVEDPRLARDELLLPGLGVYASEENLRKYADIIIPEENWSFSSQTVKEILPYFSRLCLPVTMNLHSEWTIEPWHIRCCFQRLQYYVAEECIEVPREIKGANLDYEGKEFYVNVTINSAERVPIRCVIHHWSIDPEENKRLQSPGWMHRFHEPIFEEDREFLQRMKRMDFGTKAKDMPHMKKHLEKHTEWRRSRDEQLQNI